MQMMACVSAPRITASCRLAAVPAPCVPVQRRAACTVIARAADDKAKAGSSSQEGDEEWQKPLSASQFFGSYLQLGVWIGVLGFAGITGIQKVRCVALTGQCFEEDIGICEVEHQTANSAPGFKLRMRMSHARC